MAGSEAPSEALTLEDWHRTIDTNLTGAFLFAQAVGPYMMKQKKGKVVNTSSTNADEGTPLITAYCVSKAGLSSFTRCLASEWGPFNINVNAIAPGYMATENTRQLWEDPVRNKAILDRIPAGRWGTPEDLQGIAVFLASDASNYMQGYTVAVDGGWLSR